jgi:succinylglutamic semialdehyde dehydrogenase
LTQNRASLEFKGSFIGGNFNLPGDPNGSWSVKSPADETDVLAKVSFSYEDIDRSVSAAKDAFKKWKSTSIGERAAFLKKYQDALKRRQEELAQVIAREVGKPLWESKTEVTTMINKVDVSIGEGMKLVESHDFPTILEGTNGTYAYRPHGVMAVLGPFNFPGHLPTGHIVPALLTGNTVVFKPSEKSPMVGQIVAECFAEAGLPEGVFNLIHGEKEVGRRLVVHEGIDGVLFTGSYEVGTRIKQDTLQQHWKILALEMGGKNPAIVWDDADFEVALLETFFGAFVTAGQRCSATSRIIVHEKLIDRFISEFHERSKAFKIGHPLDNPFMGPLIDSSVADRYLKFMAIAQREGCELVMRGKSMQLDYKGNYVSPSICWVKNTDLDAVKKSVYQQTELFAPNVAVMAASDLDEAVALANATQYGLVASVFSKSKETFGHCFEELQFGLVNWNKSTVGASSKLPFGGLKKSGNHRPSASFASFYCTYPVASLEVEAPKANASSYLGLNWK